MGDTCSTADEKPAKQAGPKLMQVSEDQLLFKNNPAVFSAPAGLEPICLPEQLPGLRFTPESYSTFHALGSYEEARPEAGAPLVCEWGPGYIYFGQVAGGLRLGWGRYLSEDGSVYEGEWRAGKSEGRGRVIHPSGDRYEGDWRADRIEGVGRYTGFDGASYEGEWRLDKQQGHGREVWTDGSTYEGRYEDGLKDGVGIFRWADG
jgi:hypothetical protein